MNFLHHRIYQVNNDGFFKSIKIDPVVRAKLNIMEIVTIDQ